MRSVTFGPENDTDPVRPSPSDAPEVVVGNVGPPVACAGGDDAPSFPLDTHPATPTVATNRTRSPARAGLRVVIMSVTNLTLSRAGILLASVLPTVVIRLSWPVRGNPGVHTCFVNPERMA